MSDLKFTLSDVISFLANNLSGLKKIYIQAALTFQKNWFYLLQLKPFKMIKSVFYFMLKALFVLEVFKGFVLTFAVMLRNSLIRKLWLVSKCMTVQTGQQIITIHILPNISRINRNQSLFLKILGNTCIVFDYYPVCDIINSGIRLSFLIKLISYMNKKSGQNFKYLENKKIF